MRIIKIHKPDKKKIKRIKRILPLIVNKHYIDKNIVYLWLEKNNIKDKDLDLLLKNNEVTSFSTGKFSTIILENDSSSIKVQIINGSITIKI